MILLILIIVGQGPTALAVPTALALGAGGVDRTFFSLVSHFSFMSHTLISPGDGPILTEILSETVVKPKTISQ